ncbi:hypothetical protein H5T88_02655 [bacterium]|nr:hypothetical protein [bacterium]
MSNSFKSETAPILFEKILASIGGIKDKEAKQEALTGVLESIGRARLGDSAYPLFKKAIEIIREIKGSLSSFLFTSFAEALKESNLGEKGEELESEIWELGKAIKGDFDKLTTALHMALTLHLPQPDKEEPNWEKARNVLARLKGKRRLDYKMFEPISYEIWVGTKKGYIEETKEMIKETLNFALRLPERVLSEPEKMRLLTTILEGMEDEQAGEEILNFVLDIVSQKRSLLNFISLLGFALLITSMKLPPDSPVYTRFVGLAKEAEEGEFKNVIMKMMLEKFLESDVSWMAVREVMLALEEEGPIPAGLFYLARIRQMAERGDFTSGIEEAELQNDKLRATVLKIVSAVVSRRAREG